MVCRISTICILSFTFTFFACQQADSDIGNETGNLILRLTDAPFPYDQISAVNVDISRLELLPADQIELSSSVPENALENITSSHS